MRVSELLSVRAGLTLCDVEGELLTTLRVQPSIARVPVHIAGAILRASKCRIAHSSAQIVCYPTQKGPT